MSEQKLPGGSSCFLPAWRWGGGTDILHPSPLHPPFWPKGALGYSPRRAPHGGHRWLSQRLLVPPSPLPPGSMLGAACAGWKGVPRASLGVGMRGRRTRGGGLSFPPLEENGEGGGLNCPAPPSQAGQRGARGHICSGRAGSAWAGGRTGRERLPGEARAPSSRARVRGPPGLVDLSLPLAPGEPACLETRPGSMRPAAGSADQGFRECEPARMSARRPPSLGSDPGAQSREGRGGFPQAQPGPGGHPCGLGMMGWVVAGPAARKGGRGGSLGRGAFRGRAAGCA